MFDSNFKSKYVQTYIYIYKIVIAFVTVYLGQ